MAAREVDHKGVGDYEHSNAGLTPQFSLIKSGITLADSKLDEAKLRYEPVYIVPNTFVSHLSGYPHQFMLYWHIDLLALISDGLLACVLHLHEHIMSQ